MLLPVPTSLCVAAVDTQAVFKHISPLNHSSSNSLASSRCQAVAPFSAMSSSSTGTVIHITTDQRAQSIEKHPFSNSQLQSFDSPSFEEILVRDSCEFQVSRVPKLTINKLKLPKNRRLINAIKNFFSRE